MSDGKSVGAPLPPKPLDQDKLEDAARALLIALGQGDKQEVMRNSPRRIAEMYADIINSPSVDIEIPWKTFENPGIHDLVMITDVHYITMCEHHLAPSIGIAHFGYVPDKFITGYSKVKKALNYIARQPQLNERILKQALDGCEQSIAPKGLGLILASVHMCLVCKANAPSQEIVVVQDFRGVMKDDPYRRDFMMTAYGKRPVFGAGA